MTNLFKWLLSSFDNNTFGASARKLTAFALIVCIVYLHYKHVDNTVVVQVIIVDLVGSAFFLGLVTVSNIIAFRNGTILREKTTTETTETTTTEEIPQQ